MEQLVKRKRFFLLSIITSPEKTLEDVIANQGWLFFFLIQFILSALWCVLFSIMSRVDTVSPEFNLVNISKDVRDSFPYVFTLWFILLNFLYYWTLQFTGRWIDGKGTLKKVTTGVTAASVLHFWLFLLLIVFFTVGYCRNLSFITAKPHLWYLFAITIEYIWFTILTVKALRIAHQFESTGKAIGNYCIAMTFVLFFGLIFGIIAAIAIPAYHDVTIRARVTDGLMAAKPFKADIAASLVKKGKAPAPFQLSSTQLPDHVASIASDKSGAITITYQFTKETRTVILKPEYQLGDEQVTWNCQGGTLDYYARPPQCRDPAQKQRTTKELSNDNSS